MTHGNLFIGKMHFFVVFTYLVVHGLCWVSEKCFLYEDYVDFGSVTACPKSNLTGHCQNISNVIMDLFRVPSKVEALCLDFVKGSSVQSKSLSRFKNLQYLGIFGEMPDILPGAFKNLSRLQTLFFDCLRPSTFSLSSEVLSDLQNLRTLIIITCKVSKMGVDVFRGLMKLEQLIITDNTDDFSELLCRLTLVSSTLKELTVEIPKTTLGHPKCTFTNGTSFVVKQFSFEHINLNFLHVTVLDKTALKYFQKLSSLAIGWKEFNALRAEMKKVDFLLLTSMHSLHQLESVCKAASKLLTTRLTVSFFDITDYFLPNLENCSMLLHFEIRSVNFQHESLNFTLIGALRNLITLTVVEWKVSEKHIKNILALCENQQVIATKLHSVFIISSKIRNISCKQFSCLRELEDLTWRNSEIEYIEDFSFTNNVFVKFLDLSWNKISNLTAYTFFGLLNLETLLLTHNHLIVLEELTFMHLKSIKDLQLGLFQYQSIESSHVQINLSFIFGIFPENLTYLYMKSGIRPIILILGKDSKPIADLHLHVIGQSVTFHDCEGPLFESLAQLTVETDRMLCGQSFPARFLKSLKHLEITLQHKTTQMDLTDLNQLVHLKSLVLKNVDLSLQPSLNVIFHNLSSLEFLRFSSCWIPLLDNDLSRDLQSLKLLYLNIDNAYSVTESFLEPLHNLRYLVMENPLLHCSCENVWMTEWAKYQQHVQVFLSWCSVEKLPCKSADETKLLSKYVQDHCVLDVEFLFFVCSLVGILFFMLVVLLHQLAGEYLLVFFHIARGWLEEATRANKGGHYSFDVFVSYCGRDERWVVDELLPNLEQRGPPFLRLCLHSRDFQPGKAIVENITDSLYRSRYTLCLVSRNYLRSNWCSVEMRLATYRLLAEHKDILVLVFLETIPSDLISVHHRLARLMKTKTYIDWPQDPAQRNAFWDKLWTKLAPEPAT
ncbi:toll-like receptor 12 [Brachyhypopomus gauderio]|uniref:toll-like receptor 12 n=1 Tax=Brachyhypopomus gauderio TaxID=698409 RepID=UPI0040434DFF